MDAMAHAPTVALACPLAERVACWCEDEPVLQETVGVITEALEAALPTPDPQLIAACRGHADRSQLVARLLADRDEQARLRQATRIGDVVTMPALVTNTHRTRWPA
jgi:hypothetical protein